MTFRAEGRRPAGRRARWTRAAAALAGAALLAAGCARRAERHRVVIHAFRFDPPMVAVAVGDTVEWVNEDIVPHTTPATARQWDSGSIAIRGAWRWVATGRGEMVYGCSFHPTMKGSLVVR